MGSLPKALFKVARSRKKEHGCNIAFQGRGGMPLPLSLCHGFCVSLIHPRGWSALSVHVESRRLFCSTALNASDKNVLEVSFHLPSSTNHAACINRTEDRSALLPRLRWNSQFTSALFLGNCQGVIKQEANCRAAALKGREKNTGTNRSAHAHPANDSPRN